MYARKYAALKRDAVSIDHWRQQGPPKMKSSCQFRLRTIFSLLREKT
jgi:hypothetical protein